MLPAGNAAETVTVVVIALFTVSINLFGETAVLVIEFRSDRVSRYSAPAAMERFGRTKSLKPSLGASMVMVSNV